MSATQFEIAIFQADAEIGRFSIAPGEYTIGRASASSIPIKFGPVSRQHARLVVSEDGSVAVEDLGSANGTQLGNTTIAGLTRWPPGQTLRVGEATLQLLPIAADRPADDYAPTLSPSDVGQQEAPLPASVSLASVTVATDEMHVLTKHLPLADGKRQRLDVEKEVARGGMGAVLAARESATRRTVAMKVMLKDGDAKSTLRFIEEAQVTAQLEHPNIVPIYDLGIDARGQPFYTMKLVSGITLKKVLELIEEGRAETVAKYPLGTLLTIFQKICDALAFAHSKGVIHRDLKPANIMLGRYGEVMVMDWGLAKVVGAHRAEEAETFNPEVTVLSARREESGDFHTMSGSVMGTVHYMSPEQARGEIESLDARSDVFTLGTILYEILTLERPFAGRNAAEIIAKITVGEFVPPAQRVAAVGQAPRLPAETAPRQPERSPCKHLPNGRVPESLDAIVRKAMALAPAARYASVGALQADLLAYQNGFATSAEEKTAWKQFKLLIKRNKAASMGAAAVVLLSAGFMVKVFADRQRIRGERDRAEQALADLRRTVPTFIEQARLLAQQQDFTGALDRIETALALHPAHADSHLRHGHVLQALDRHADAAVAFQAAARSGSHDAGLAENERLSRALAAAQAAQTLSPRDLLSQLYQLSMKEGRTGEALHLASQLQLSAKELVPALQQKLNAKFGPKGPKIEVKEGRLDLALTDPSFADLSIIAGMPLNALELSKSAVTDLAPLRGMPLERIHIGYTAISDLSPLEGMRLTHISFGHSRARDTSALRGMPIEWLVMDNIQSADVSVIQSMPLRRIAAMGCSLTNIEFLAGKPLEIANLQLNKIADLAPLAGLPLKQLFFGGNPIRSLEPLRGLPLGVLTLDGCPKELDLRPLLDCQQLESLVLPATPKNLADLRQHPRLRAIAFTKTAAEGSASLPARKFWELHDELVKQGKPVTRDTFAALQASNGMTAEYVVNDGTVTSLELLRGKPYTLVDVMKNPVADLEPLRAMESLEVLRLSQTKITSLEPLRGLKLTELHLGGCGALDLAPLRGMPLRMLGLDQSKISDLSPLLDCPTLEAITIPRGARNIELLRQFPNLKRLSYDWTGDLTGGPSKIAAEFWAEWDAAHAAKK